MTTAKIKKPIPDKFYLNAQGPDEKEMLAYAISYCETYAPPPQPRTQSGKVLYFMFRAFDEFKLKEEGREDIDLPS